MEITRLMEQTNKYAYVILFKCNAKPLKEPPLNIEEFFFLWQSDQHFYFSFFFFYTRIRTAEE